MLVFIKRVVSKSFEWCWKREKSFMLKVVQKGACLDCGFEFCMECGFAAKGDSCPPHGNYTMHFEICADSSHQVDNYLATSLS
jgi:hypothetical protein